MVLSGLQMAVGVGVPCDFLIGCFHLCLGFSHIISDGSVHETDSGNMEKSRSLGPSPLARGTLMWLLVQPTWRKAAQDQVRERKEEELCCLSVKG